MNMLSALSRRAAVLAAALIFAFASGPVAGQGLFGQQTDYATIDLHSGRDGDEGARIALLRVELKPGWKTYWRNPGDAGIPPFFDWAGSTNLKSVAIDWPTPTVFDTYGSRTIGYKDRMTLPLTLTPENPDQPIGVRLQFSYGLCSDICIPAQQDIALSIPPGAPEDGVYFLDRAFATAPVDASQGGLAMVECRIEGAGGARTFHAAMQVNARFVTAPVVVVEGPEGVWFGPTSLSARDNLLLAEGAVETDANRWIDRGDLNITVLGPERAITQHGCATTG